MNDPTAVWNADGSDKTGGALGLRIGLHVQNALGSNSNSDSFVDSSFRGIATVPAPSSDLLLGVGGFCVVGFVAWRRPRRAKAAA